MVGILLVTHDGLGGSLVECVKHVLGEVPHNLKSLSVHAWDEPQQKLVDGEELIKELDIGGGVLILTDMYGATPSNIGRQLCRSERVHGVAGVNLPMLLRVVSRTGLTLPELADAAVSGGRDCIVHMNHELG
ncbi:MAG: PTS fructose transporter subunit IIA [Gallionellales bacterium GWA2_60_142]|nr:MAG: PTS fructose transporter subunit IIA [Gallionellales bacterium GWA2_60_142]HCI13615.1 PTS fructose transporter subunit IIA [Gallionellaceae bacterium]